jgi:hypothetical protein
MLLFLALSGLHLLLKAAPPEGLLHFAEVLEGIPYWSFLAWNLGFVAFLLLYSLEYYQQSASPENVAPPLERLPGRQSELWQLRFFVVLAAGTVALFISAYGTLANISLKELALLGACLLPLIPSFLMGEASGAMAPKQGLMAKWDDEVPGLAERRRLVAAWLWVGSTLVALPAVVQFPPDSSFYFLMFLINALPVMQIGYAYYRYRKYVQEGISAEFSDSDEH